MSPAHGRDAPSAVGEAGGPAPPLLEVHQVSRRFGGVQALSAVSLELAPGEILGIIGPNGGGKTTLVNLVTGSLRPSSGRIRFRGLDLAGLPPHRIARLGITRTFQVSRAFLGMTVEDNIRVGALFGCERERSRQEERVEAVLGFLDLASRRALPVHALNIPDRKRVDLGRALAMKPTLLLLDELMAGLGPGDLEHAIGLARQIHRQGITLVIIEHVMRVILNLCQRVLVLHHGQVIADGPPAGVLEDPAVLAAYLGPRYPERLVGVRPEAG